MSKAYFISGIDTDAGKTYVTGHIARHLMKEGKRVITQKFIQTGNAGMSEDIEVHRRIMGIRLLRSSSAIPRRPSSPPASTVVRSTSG